MLSLELVTWNSWPINASWLCLNFRYAPSFRSTSSHSPRNWRQPHTTADPDDRSRDLLQICVYLYIWQALGYSNPGEALRDGPILTISRSSSLMQSYSEPIVKTDPASASRGLPVRHRCETRNLWNSTKTKADGLAPCVDARHLMVLQIASVLTASILSY